MVVALRASLAYRRKGNRGHFLAPGNHSILIPKGATDGFHHRFKRLLDQWITTARQRIYVVREGDNLSIISQRFDVQRWTFVS